MPLVAQRHLFGWTFVLCMVMCGLLTYATWLEAVSKYQIGSFVLERGTAVPTWPARFAPPASFGLLTLLFLFKFLAYVLGSDILQCEKPRFGALGQCDGPEE
jgi:TRAP-type mannitol/chloroaromatic compound transport system permease small subunit